jgi:hypothetical protein
MTNTTTALQALEEIAYRAKLAAGMTRPDEGPAQVFQQLASIARAALSAPAAQDAPSVPVEAEVLVRRPVEKIVPGSDIHFALLGAPWGYNTLRGQDYADFMAYSEAVWSAARASQPATPAQELAWSDLIVSSYPFNEFCEGQPLPYRPDLLEAAKKVAVQRCSPAGEPGLWAEVKPGVKKFYPWDEQPATPAAHPVAGQGQPVITDAMVDAYLAANTVYWQEVDAKPFDATKPWRQGTPKDATRLSLQAALRAAPTAPQAPALVPLLAGALSELLIDVRIAQANMQRAAKRDPAWEGCATAILPRVLAAEKALAAVEAAGITPTTKEQQ